MEEGKKTLQERGRAAAISYLERCGMAVADTNVETAHGKIPIVAHDGPYLVHVVYKVMSKPSTVSGPSDRVIKQRRAAMKDYCIMNGIEDHDIRLDSIVISVIGNDRALLRHHRDLAQRNV